MKSNLRITWRMTRCCATLLVALSAMWIPPSHAQSQDELKGEVQQLKEETRELKARISALEDASVATQPAAPKLVKTVAVAPGSNESPAQTKADSTVDQDLSTAAMQDPASQSGASSTQHTQVGQTTQTVSVEATTPEEKKPTMDIYGFAMLDSGYDFGQNDPNWFDVMRPTKLPAFKNEFGGDGKFYSGVRQSRLGVKANFPTALGEVKTIFEFELFGVGVDAGQTTFRLRHAWGELGQFGAGQTWSPFMDPDVFPNSIEYWGPNGMVFFRNVQLRWQPINKGNNQLWFALERPGASADLGQIADRIELQGVKSRFPAPDVSARIRRGGERTYLQVAGIARYIAWDDVNRGPALDLSGHTFGWGVNVSSNIGVAKKDTLKLSVTYGKGVENYMNDAPVDIAPSATSNPRTPIDGDALPVFGMVAFYDRYWSEHWSTSIGYSMLNIQNAALQTPDAFHRGAYGLVNLLYYPVKNVMMGGELQWGRRDNFRDGFTYDDYRIQFSARYNFDYKLGAK